MKQMPLTGAVAVLNLDDNGTIVHSVRPAWTVGRCNELGGQLCTYDNPDSSSFLFHFHHLVYVMLFLLITILLITRRKVGQLLCNPPIEISTEIKLFHISFLFSGNLGNEALVVTKNDEVFAVGSNAAGCLGLGDLQSTLFPKKVEALCNKNVKGMKYNPGFMAVYAIELTVFETKYNEILIKCC
jgi:hypothetical protein